jgi:hypothetical protein
MIYDEVISKLIKERNVKVVLADRWNSIKILSDIEADFPGVVAAQYSLKYRDMSITRSHLEAGTLILPKRETDCPIIELLDGDMEGYPYMFKSRPIDHLAVQLMTVQDTGLQVIKGDGFTDDIWRALALGVWGMSTEKYAELMVGEAAPRGPITAIGVSRLGSSGSTSMSSAGQYSTSTLGVMLRGR